MLAVVELTKRYSSIPAVSEVSFGMASIERTMLEHPARFVIFYTAAFAVLGYLVFRRRQLPLSERTVIYDEQPEPAVRTLNLSH